MPRARPVFWSFATLGAHRRMISKFQENNRQNDFFSTTVVREDVSKFTRGHVVLFKFSAIRHLRGETRGKITCPTVGAGSAVDWARLSLAQVFGNDVN
ncbi:Hypothetical protein NTJ_01001 [Nesidiocoris tenuis]|uniref:Uncharacterized protein n=1 Tax=Nesidiocoris tenuis TaxID=355587 RepID=A0ABN7A7E0_9HEMI|nr:Hypothetical protein NTJ_01001 [Nesidiocoris tenuis]